MGRAIDKVRNRVRTREELDKAPPLVEDDLERLDGEDAAVASLVSVDLAELDAGGCRGCGQPPSPQVAAGNPEALAAYWEDRMSCEPGDFEDCVNGVSQYVDNPEGYCQERHIAACGEPAGKGAHGGSLPSAHVAYSEDQERDSDGKFSSGGGGGSNPKGEARSVGDRSLGSTWKARGERVEVGGGGNKYANEVTLWAKEVPGQNTDGLMIGHVQPPQGSNYLGKPSREWSGELDPTVSGGMSRWESGVSGLSAQQVGERLADKYDRAASGRAKEDEVRARNRG